MRGVAVAELGALVLALAPRCPVGRCVMRTAESAVLTPCPPGPDDAVDVDPQSRPRARRPRRRRPRGSPPPRRSSSGRRLEASNGEMRTRRCTPVSPSQVAVGVLAGHLDGRRLDARLLAGEQIDDLGLEPRRARTSAGTCAAASGPSPGTRCRPPRDGSRRWPALASCGPGEHDLQLELRRAPRRRRRHASRRSRRRALPSPASAASSRSTASPRPARASSFTRPTSRDSSVRSRMSSWARRLSSQKVGDAISASSAASRCLLGGDVKDAPGARRAGASSSVTSRLKSPSITRLDARRRQPGDAARHSQGQVGEPVAEARVERVSGAQRARARSASRARTERSARHDLSGRGDERRDPGVGRPDDGHAMLDRPEGVHGQVLPRAARPAEPCVVGHVHHQARATPHEAHGRARGRCPRNRSRRRTGRAGPGRRSARAPGSSSAMNSAQPRTNPISPTAARTPRTERG